MELYAREINTVAQLAEWWGYDVRQGNYYAAAAAWLGFISRSGDKRELTPLGKKFLDASRPARFPILFAAVAATPVFREAIRRNLEGKPMPVREIAELIQAKGYSNRTTANRRAQTVISWLVWLWREHANLKA